MSTYRYVNQWNQKLLRPMAGAGYLDETEARDRYESGGDAFEVLPEPNAATGVPAWCARVFTSDGSFRIHHFNEHGSIVRTTGFRRYDGRLFHDEIIDYFYPDGEHRLLRRSQSTSQITTYMKPDGTSKVIHVNVVPGQESVEEYRGASVDSYWAEPPEFGDWETLTNANYGDPL